MKIDSAVWTPPVAPQPLPGAARAAGLQRRDAWRALRAACAPFRDGTRFRVLPDVRFWRDTARLRAPGTALPGPSDRSPAAYRARLAAEGAQEFALRVDEPLLADAALWQAARTLLRDALGADAVPVLPVAAALTLRTGHAPVPWTWPDGHARLIAVLDGALRLDDGRRVAAGDALWWPADAGAPPHETGALLLSLCIATDPATIAHAAAEATDALLRDLLDRQWPDDGAVDMQPFPPPIGARGLALPPALHAVARALSSSSLHDTLAEALDLDACLRASSRGLLPIPAVRHAPLHDDARVRLASDGVIRRRLDDRRWLLAVNGHVQRVDARPAWRRAWTRLCTGVPQRVGDLLGGARDRDAMRDRLDALHALGALDRIEEPAP
jgi:hypothetical protein